jgi:hypothetical protein
VADFVDDGPEGQQRIEHEQEGRSREYLDESGDEVRLAEQHYIEHNEGSEGSDDDGRVVQGFQYAREHADNPGRDERSLQGK